MTRKRVLLIEPAYRNKYPPLGLMKLAAYHGPNGRNDEIRFIKGRDRSALQGAWDRIYVTTLFTFEWDRTADSIDFAISAANNQPERVFVGGIAASLMNDQFVDVPRWAGVRFIQGLLDQPPAQSLQLSAESFEFGSNDLTGTPIDELIPNYDILDQIPYRYPVYDAYFGYASRGCIRKCSFCGVPKLEGAQKEMPPLAQLVNGVDLLYGPKKDLILMDNNITASNRYKEVIAEIRDLGFTPGAVVDRPGSRPAKRRVDFNQGVDARILSKSEMFLRELSTICISPLRIAFDHIGFRKVYETSVRMAESHGITSLSNYMLYNFMDSPVDLYERMRLNIALNEELGIRIWSFPMRYQPVTLKDRSHVGKRWTNYSLRSFQLMLQATRGVVSGNPSFFLSAYGGTSDEFESLLMLPHAFIFDRRHYEIGQGAAERDEYENIRSRLSKAEKRELSAIIARSPRNETQRRDFFSHTVSDSPANARIRRLLQFHMLRPGKPEIPEPPSFRPPPSMSPESAMDIPPDDEFVEDAGLFEPESAA